MRYVFVRLRKNQSLIKSPPNHTKPLTDRISVDTANGRLYETQKYPNSLEVNTGNNTNIAEHFLPQLFRNVLDVNDIMISLGPVYFYTHRSFALPKKLAVIIKPLVNIADNVKGRTLYEGPFPRKKCKSGMQ